MSDFWAGFVAQAVATSRLEIWAVVTGFLCVLLTVREHIWCWPIGIASAVLYILVFGQSRLYADAGLQVVFVLLQFYGWYEWLYGGKGREALHVQVMPRWMWTPIALGFLAGTALLASTLYKFTNASLPWLDSTQTVLSLIAQYLLSFKYIENWVLWLVVDALSIEMYIYKELYMTAGLYVVFFILAGVGLVQWRRVLSLQARD